MSNTQNFKSFSDLARAQHALDIQAANNLRKTQGARAANKRRAAEKKQAELAERVKAVLS